MGIDTHGVPPRYHGFCWVLVTTWAQRLDLKWRRRCREHRLEGDVDVRNKRCEASASCNRRYFQMMWNEFHLACFFSSGIKAQCDRCMCRVYKKVTISDSAVRACAQCYRQWKQEDTKVSQNFSSWFQPADNGVSRTSQFLIRSLEYAQYAHFECSE